MGESKHVKGRIARDSAGASDMRYGAGLFAACGLFLVFSGAATAIISLLTSAAGEQVGASSGPDMLTSMHVIGLLAGLLGGALLIVGIASLLYSVVFGKRRQQKPAA